MYLDSLISDHFLAYVVGPRFENPIFYSVLRSNTNRNYSFSRIGDAKSSKLTNGYTVTSCQATYFPIGQAALAASEQSSSYINYFSKFYLRVFLKGLLKVNDNTN